MTGFIKYIEKKPENKISSQKNGAKDKNIFKHKARTDAELGILLRTILMERLMYLKYPPGPILS